MKKIIWIILAIVSLLISLFINFNNTSFRGFLESSILYWLLIFLIPASIIIIIQVIRNKNFKKMIFFALFLIFIILLLNFFNKQFSGICNHQEVRPHLRTNILTGKCNYGGASINSCPGGNYPWYYKRGCDISDEEKLQVIKQSKDAPILEGITLESQNGEENSVDLEISNPDNHPRCFRIEFRCMQPEDEGNMCDPEIGKVSDVGVGGFNNEVSTPWFRTFEEVDIDRHESEMYPISYLIKNLGKGRYTLRLNLYRGDTTCDKATEFTLYQSKNFYMKVK